MHLDIRTLGTPDAQELYVTATPAPHTPVPQAAASIFATISGILRERGAHLLQERVFATREAMAEIARVRASMYRSLDDGVPPAWLAVPAGPTGDLVGVQVHAVVTPERPTPLAHGDTVGRLFRAGARQWLVASGLTAPAAGDAAAQMQTLFERADAFLHATGGDFSAVARTWLWLGDILAWYGDLNRVRSHFFTERGLIAPGVIGRLPASTGIGVYPADGGACALDLFAVWGDATEIRDRPAAGKQDAALNYGSAFSRATLAPTPAGETVFISGTAAIDAAGRTAHVGDAEAQIRMTLENIRAVLADFGADGSQVLTALAYCKTPAVMEAWQAILPAVPWPIITMQADVCRDDLLFEMEVTASPTCR